VLLKQLSVLDPIKSSLPFSISLISLRFSYQITFIDMLKLSTALFLLVIFGFACSGTDALKCYKCAHSNSVEIPNDNPNCPSTDRSKIPTEDCPPDVEKCLNGTIEVHGERGGSEF
jgi:hypothetical protein